eukprot:scaffold10734_cov71-Cylindrotheca_fusiformis.AAC.1
MPAAATFTGDSFNYAFLVYSTKTTGKESVGSDESLLQIAEMEEMVIAEATSKQQTASGTRTKN